MPQFFELLTQQQDQFDLAITGKQDAKTTLDNIAKFQQDKLKEVWPDRVADTRDAETRGPLNAPARLTSFYLDSACSDHDMNTDRMQLTQPPVAVHLAPAQLEARHSSRLDRLSALAILACRPRLPSGSLAPWWPLVAAAFVVNAYRRKYYGGLLVAPAIAVLFVMNIFPLLWSLGLSFFAYQSNQQTIRFVGLNNYIKVLTNDLAAPANWNALINTAMFVVCTVSAQMIVGFLLAMLFAKQFPLRKYLLILVLTPMMLSVVASGVFFSYYYDPTFGILSYVMGESPANSSS